MAAVFAVCAVLGGTVMVCQFLMALVGLGHGSGDMGGGAAGSDFAVGDDFSGSDFGGTDHFGGGDHVGAGDHAGAGHDAGHDSAGHHGHTSTWFFGIITFRTVVAAVAFFGLAGLAAQANEASPPKTLLIAAAAGVAAMYAVYWMMRALTMLNAEGTVHLDRAVGHHGTVYLRIPGNNAGTGKIHLNLQNRTIELEAVTSQDDLQTGASVVVVGLVSPNTVDVQALPESERTSS